jgi:hypothetical protein
MSLLESRKIPCSIDSAHGIGEIRVPQQNARIASNVLRNAAKRQDYFIAFYELGTSKKTIVEQRPPTKIQLNQTLDEMILKPPKILYKPLKLALATQEIHEQIGELEFVTSGSYLKRRYMDNGKQATAYDITLCMSNEGGTEADAWLIRFQVMMERKKVVFWSRSRPPRTR